jgi:putative redox protein
MNHEVNVTWNNNMNFDCKVGNYVIKVDASTENGGNNLGPSPKPLLLAALGGCTGMDIVSLLKKMRVEFTGLNIRLQAIVNDEHPKKYNEIKVIYEISGKDIDFEKVQKSVNLSTERYCGVYATLAPSVKLTHEILLL